MALTEEQLRKLDEFVASEKGVELKSLLNNFKDTTKEIEVYGVKLSVLPTIPRNLRHELTKFESIQDDVEETEKQIYYIMSRVCVNEPYNHPETWEYLDEKTGMVPDVMKEAFNLAYEIEQKIKKFR